MIFGIIINIHERQHCHSSGDAPVSLHPARVISSKGMLYGATNDSEHTCSACTAARPTVGLRSTSCATPSPRRADSTTRTAGLTPMGPIHDTQQTSASLAVMLVRC